MAEPNIEGGAPPPDSPPPDSFRPTDTVRLEDAPPLEPVAPPPSSEPDKPLPGSQTPHARGMQAILEARRKRVEDEVAAGERMAGRPEPTPVSVDVAPTVTPEPRLAPEETTPLPAPEPRLAPEPPPQPQYQQPPQPRVHRIVVRGQAIDLSEQDMVRAAQYAVEQEANRREAVLREQQQPPPPPEPQFDRPRLAETVKALQYGDEEAATDALAQLTSEIARTIRPPAGPPQQQIDPAVIADHVYQRVSNVQSLENALIRFQNDYPDIVSDAQATRLAALEAEDLRKAYEAQGIQQNVEQIMRTAADNVRATISRWRGGDPATTPPTITPVKPAPLAPALAANGNRVAVKRSIPQVPAAASAPQPADRPNVKSGVTGTEIVDWMRRTRGQPVYSR